MATWKLMKTWMKTEMKTVIQPLLTAVCFALVMLCWVPTAQALPQGNAITDPKALLRNSLPIANPTVRKLQSAIEDISTQLRANRRWGAVQSDLSRADRLLNDKVADLLATVPDDRKAQAEALIAEMKTAVTTMQENLASKDKQLTSDQRAALLDRVGALETLMTQGFPYEVPADYADRPQLKGRATIAFKTSQGDLKAVVDGYSAPVTAGNFVDLVQRGFYNGLPFIRAEDFYVLQTGDPEGPDQGFIDPKTKQYRAVPLEILVKGDQVPTYNITLEDAGRYLDQPVLPFSAYGAMAMARPNDEPNGGSSQFFFFLFEPELTPAGLNLLDGRYSIFGYVTEGSDILRSLKAGDKILSAQVIEGSENLINGGR
jgi:peptidylprolyl isomerase